jgi:hypothetical protein
MTTPFIPELIFGLFQDEIKKINVVYVSKVCSLYGIDFNDAMKKLECDADMGLTLTNTEKIRLVKKQKEPEPHERCIARVYRKKELEVLQCSRRHQCGAGMVFCKRHQTMHDEGRLKYGTISEEKPSEVTSPVLIKKKKITIF